MTTSEGVTLEQLRDFRKRVEEVAVEPIAEYLSFVAKEKAFDDYIASLTRWQFARFLCRQWLANYRIRKELRKRGHTA